MRSRANDSTSLSHSYRMKMLFVIHMSIFTAHQELPCSNTYSIWPFPSRWSPSIEILTLLFCNRPIATMPSRYPSLVFAGTGICPCVGEDFVTSPLAGTAHGSFSAELFYSDCYGSYTLMSLITSYAVYREADSFEDMQHVRLSRKPRVKRRNKVQWRAPGQLGTILEEHT